MDSDDPVAAVTATAGSGFLYANPVLPGAESKQTPASGSDAKPPVSSSPGSSPPASPKTWSCGACTFLNHPSREKCEMCNNARPSAVHVRPQLVQRTPTGLGKAEADDHDDAKHKSTPLHLVADIAGIEPGGFAELEQKLEFTITPRKQEVTLCTATFHGPPGSHCEVKAAVQEGHASTYTLTVTLPLPGEYTVDTFVGIMQSSWKIRTAPVLVVCDIGLHQVLIFRTTGDRRFIRKIGQKGSGECEFLRPEQAAITPDAMLVVADSENKRVQLLRWNGEFVRAIPTTGLCTGVAVDTAGLIYAADETNSVIRVFRADGTKMHNCGFKSGLLRSGDGSLSAPCQLSMLRDQLLVANSLKERIEMFKCSDGKFSGHIDTQVDVFGVCADDRGFVYTTHAKGLVVWGGASDSRRLLRSINHASIKSPHGVCVRDGLLYICTHEKKTPVRVFAAYEGTPVADIGEGIVQQPWGVTVV